MTRPPARHRIALVGAPDGLAGLEPALSAHRIALERVPVLTFRAVGGPALLRQLHRFGSPDALLVGSGRAIDFFVGAWLAPPSTARTVAWAVGATTAERMRRLGWRRVRTAPREGIEGAIAALGPGRGRRLLYPRSDRAGPGAARLLRARGWNVWDPVVYRTETRGPLGATERRALETASAWIVTSPSALSAVRRRLGARRFGAVRRRMPVIALGERTLRAARGHGFRRAESVGSATVEALTYYVVRRFADGSPSPARTVSIPSPARPRRGA